MFFKRENHTGLIRTPEEEHKLIPGALRIFSILFVGIALLLLAGGYLFYSSEESEYISELKAVEDNSLALKKAAINRALDRAAADVLFLASQNELILHLDTGDLNAARDMEREYLHLANSRQVYDQIRYLDASGRELVRIENRDGRFEVAPQNRLRNEGQRYYFQDCIRLNKGELFLSPLDLKAENGKIEEPVKPMLRFGTPVFDSVGRKRGIVLVNYKAQDLLDRIREQTAATKGTILLLDSEGYWLIGPDKSKEWGFMFPNKADETFARAFPDEWKQMLADGKGQFCSDNGLFTFAIEEPAAILKQFLNMIRASTVPAPDNDRPSPYFWVLVSRVSSDNLESHAGATLTRLFVGGGILFVLISIGAWYLAMAVSRRQEYEKQLVSAAMYDTLTELPNRKLFFDRLDAALSLSQRYEYRLVLLFIDLDGFKEVNDTFGHEAGDELLKRVGTILKNSVRRSDTVARLGGDEFVVMLNKVSNVGDAVLVGEKLVSALRAPITLKAGRAVIGASIGVSVFPEHGDTAEILVQKADQAMYVSKRKGKNTCTIADSSRCADV
ncbi:sensor domain-containing diguanylate cyclase [uncultured Pseudodesulfovibrio sp.]|uniref:sensor domain-containing diguanylate cyclase n=1 Tax=uncultured Pseudodesulfovibrio sp. TaxID=2035858 RepID=UPI0029C686EE|nr:sensor domain-containing diguanylate cyclase [uncultured Pseudodesulfovibrio sp.]